MFKVGDKVRRTRGGTDIYGMENGNVYTVTKILDNGNAIRVEGIINKKYFSEFFELVEDKSNHHKFHDIICAWAKGAKVQFRMKDTWGEWGEWISVENPTWFGYGYEIEYRIKPEPKPDVVYKKYVYESGIKKLCQCDGAGANVKYTFDGETGKLKDVEILK